MQLVSINCAWFIHLFLKWLEKVVSIHYLDENSTSIVMLRYITDRELIEKLLVRCLSSFININKFLTEASTNNSYLQLQTALLFLFRLVFLFCLVTLPGFLGIVAYQLFSEYETSSIADKGIIVFLLASFYGFFAVAIAMVMACWFTVKLVTELFKHTKYFLIFLILFSANYYVICNALYFLGLILPFDKTNAMYVLIGFLFFSFAYIKMIISLF